ncbi:hypothetical protein [Lepagella muris]|uniref:Uncharacterized protein n=1 Tax=Lepagella muris TaxID=3032870 RepID=A0AC61RIX8_9BACT|nr:hypothetical protein [Lepagella muris]TGY80983.1 hypothetical protein E5331_00965 [Lepagella muris]THG54061.1 hypothetical protein E5984_00965 [Bacteroidales bacterium]TKC56684.1 hypothetical protein E5359_013060 [Bacteroidales bacterium]
MEQKPGQINNLLEVFAEAENRRATQVMNGLAEKDTMISIRNEVSRKDIDNIQCMYNRLGHPDVSETLEHFDITSAEVFVFNEELKEMVQKMVVEMIRQGLIILDVENSKYAPKYQLTLRAMMMNPKSSVKRLHIHKKRTDE